TNSVGSPGRNHESATGHRNDADDIEARGRAEVAGSRVAPTGFVVEFPTRLCAPPEIVSRTVCPYKICPRGNHCLHRGINGMDPVLKYLDAIDAINRAERQLERRGKDDAAVLSLLDSACAEAEAAWATIPREWQSRMFPPPDGLIEM